MSQRLYSRLGVKHLRMGQSHLKIWEVRARELGARGIHNSVMYGPLCLSTFSYFDLHINSFNQTTIQTQTSLRTSLLQTRHQLRMLDTRLDKGNLEIAGDTTRHRHRHPHLPLDLQHPLSTNSLSNAQIPC